MTKQLRGVSLILMGVLLAVADVELDTELLTIFAILLGGGGLYQVFSQENQGNAASAGSKPETKEEDGTP